MRRTAIITLSVVLIGAASFGWRMGQPVTETDIINRYAADYVSTFGEGAQMTDCFATAGTGDVRLVVRCSHPDGRQAVYPAGPRGALIDMDGGPEA